MLVELVVVQANAAAARGWAAPELPSAEIRPATTPNNPSTLGVSMDLAEYPMTLLKDCMHAAEETVVAAASEAWSFGVYLEYAKRIPSSRQCLGSAAIHLSSSSEAS